MNEVTSTHRHLPGDGSYCPARSEAVLVTQRRSPGLLSDTARDERYAAFAAMAVHNLGADQGINKSQANEPITVTRPLLANARAGHPRTLPLRIGGVMRCCIETLNTTPLESEAEGTVLPCRWCKSSLRVRNGAWEWNHD